MKVRAPAEVCFIIFVLLRSPENADACVQIRVMRAPVAGGCDDKNPPPPKMTDYYYYFFLGWVTTVEFLIVTIWLSFPLGGGRSTDGRESTAFPGMSQLT